VTPSTLPMVSAGVLCGRPAAQALEEIERIHRWFLKRLPKHALPLDSLLKSILEARRAMLSAKPVRVNDFFRRPKKEAVAICPRCREAYDPRADDCCKGCRHGTYFDWV